MHRGAAFSLLALSLICGSPVGCSRSASETSEKHSQPDSSVTATVDEKALAGLIARIGDKFWSAPEMRLIRATTYKSGEDASDADSQAGRSDEKIRLRYATAQSAGTLAVPEWLPRGSMVKIHTEHGLYCYIAADEGTDVESRKAARDSGKTKEQVDTTVLDFCAPEQLWPDFIIVEIFYYAGKVPFTDLSLEEQQTLFNYAMDFVSKWK